ncbi:MAG TPA: bifunctional 5,10-methylenetetrahydrofolate dehydrogenase/5,10-methenyltetrahydrofolate cyclohydrolase [Ktedonobacterales bacterium]|nr:bifunctional 5,10-methylenetetrahydrofolate dehydrogenase/5,10-methenyltetrahydrofolate cyclohydrolase [Ktedonobacterales bacterium]
MSARLLEGRVIGEAVRAALLPLATARAGELGHAPGLAIVHVGADPASLVYTRRLAQLAEGIGVAVRVMELAPSIDDAALAAAIQTLNDDPTVQGILMELPLPRHLSQRTVAETLDAAKDVDGISIRSGGSLFLRQPTFVPSTCAAVIEVLERGQIPIAGQRAVVVGASNVVGKPLAFMLLDRDATVSVCHIATRDLGAWTRQADILVVAVGKPGILTGDMVKPGATVIDVGINVVGSNGAVVGDVDFASVRAVAGAITPVPGGVGPLTNLMLLKQLLTPVRPE